MIIPKYKYRIQEIVILKNVILKRKRLDLLVITDENECSLIYNFNTLEDYSYNRVKIIFDNLSNKEVLFHKTKNHNIYINHIKELKKDKNIYEFIDINNNIFYLDYVNNILFN